VASVLERALDRLETIFAPAKYESAVDFSSNAHLERVCDEILRKNGDKSPGAIFQRLDCSTNKEVFEKFGIPGVVALVQARLALMRSSSQEEARYIADAIKLFIKFEPHKRSKITNKRWRLIWGVSLIDQIIDRALYGEMINIALKQHNSTPNKPGFNFKRGGVSRLARQYGTLKPTWRSFDARSFDITASGWGLETVAALNARLNASSSPSRADWDLIANRREQAVLYGTFVFSDGTMCRKVKPGIQPSGRFTTIDSNGKLVALCRVLWDITKGVPTNSMSFITMGDDSVQDGIADVDEFIAWTQQVCGVTLTNESFDGKPGFFHEQNFCSFEMIKHCGTYVPVPLNWEKNMYALVHPEKTEIDFSADRLQNLCIEYAFHPRFGELQALLGKYHLSDHRSQAWCQRVQTGFEVA